QNERLLATSYWNAINNAPTLKNNCSARDLRCILDTFRENIAALDLLGFPTEHWQFPLFNMLLGRLNTSIRTAFEIEHSKIKFPTYQNLTEFLNNHCRALESVQIASSTSYSQNSQQPTNSHPNRKQHNYNQYQKYPTQSYVSNIQDQNKQNSQILDSLIINLVDLTHIQHRTLKLLQHIIQTIQMLTVTETSTLQYSISVDYAIRIHITIFRNALCL
ncbi:unnamed protein product, partial [Callosobruchus maculatus]